MKPSRRSPLPLLVTLAAGWLLVLGVPAPVAGQDPGEDPAPGPPMAPEIVFGSDGIGAVGLTPGGRVAVFGVGRVPLQYLTRVVRHETVMEADGEGSVVWELPEGLPERSVWAVVDLDSGEIATSTAPDFPGAVRALPIGAIRRGPPGEPGRFGFEMEEAQVLYVRSRDGAGAWGTAIGDGGGRDVDGSDDGSIEMELEGLIPVAPDETASDDPGEEEPENSEPSEEPDETGDDPTDPEADPNEQAEPPVEARPGDILLVVDTSDLTLYTLRVTPQILD